MLDYYRRFIPDFTKITKLFTNCSKKGYTVDIKSKEYVECFELYKKILTNDPILQYSNFEKSFVLTTDGIRHFALSQNIEGKYLPIAYVSGALNEHEINYSVVEKQLLAIVWATNYSRPCLYGVKFLIRTDHKPLTWLFKIKSPYST